VKKRGEKKKRKEEKEKNRKKRLKRRKEEKKKRRKEEKEKGKGKRKKEKEGKEEKKKKEKKRRKAKAKKNFGSFLPEPFPRPPNLGTPLKKPPTMGGYSSKFLLSFGLYGFAGLQPIVIGLYYLVNTNLMQLHGTILGAHSLDEVNTGSSFSLSCLSLSLLI